jgi:hypothetical protein
MQPLAAGSISILIMGRLTAIFLAFSTVLPAAVSFQQRLAEARAQYFADLQGNRAAAEKARASFAALSRGCFKASSH